MVFKPIDPHCWPPTEPLASDLFCQFYSLIYTIPTTILYFFVVGMMKRQSSYYSPVYVKLFSLYAYLNLLSWWSSFLHIRVLSFWAVCPFWMQLSGVYWISIPYYFFASFPIGSLVCSTIIAVYQMLAIVFPTSCEVMFKKRMNTIYAMIVLIPLIFCSHVLLSEMDLWPLSPYKIYIVLNHLHEGYEFLNSFLVNIIVGVTSFAFIFFSSIISLVRYWAIKKKNNGEVKLRLFAANCYICVSTVIFICYMLIQFYIRVVLEDYDMLTVLYNYRGVLNDVCYLPIPWFILIVNRRMRSSLWKIFICSQGEVSSTVPISSNGK